MDRLGVRIPYGPLVEKSVGLRPPLPGVHELQLKYL